MLSVRSVLLMAVIAALAAGCAGPVIVTAAPDVSSPVAVDASQPASSVQPSTAPASTPLPAGWPTVMSIYPLAKGAEWKYQVVIDYASDSIGTAQHWEGSITETVVSASPAIENWVFHTTLIGDVSHTWQPVDRYNVARGSGLYRFTDESSAGAATNPQNPEPFDRQVLAWPLENGQVFGPPDLVAVRSPKYLWFVTASQQVDVPAGHYEGCFRLDFPANPDEMHSWFCPGVGFVRYEYRHHGTLQDETWELTGYTPGD